MYTFMNSICVTFLNANNVVYMVRAFENKEQQSKIVGYGSIFTMAGAMVFNVLFPTAMAKVGTDAVGWSRLVGMIAIPLTAIGMLRILTIPEKFTPVSEKNGEQTHLKDLLPLLKESRPVLIICMVRFVQNIATGLGVGTYYWQYIIGNLGMMGVASVTTILVLPLAFALPGLRKKFGMAGMSVIGILVGCIGYLATFFAGGNMVFFIVAALLVSAGAVPLNMMFNMFIADVADYNEWKGLKRMEGTMGSLTGLAGKIGSAFGGFLMGVLMSASGYVGGADVQVDSAIMMIRVLASVAPLALMLVVAAILRFYTVDKQLPQIKHYFCGQGIFSARFLEGNTSNVRCILSRSSVAGYKREPHSSTWRLTDLSRWCVLLVRRKQGKNGQSCGHLALGRSLLRIYRFV